ncbi:hypothetical protein JHK87_022384 [Glycine soja]|nr:hypothetical protein JHK87_022384 [Glycine soja]
MKASMAETNNNIAIEVFEKEDLVVSLAKYVVLSNKFTFERGAFTKDYLKTYDYRRESCTTCCPTMEEFDRTHLVYIGAGLDLFEVKLLARWLKKEGDKISPGEVLYEVETLWLLKLYVKGS